MSTRFSCMDMDVCRWITFQNGVHSRTLLVQFWLLAEEDCAVCAGVPNWAVQSLSYRTQQSGAPASSIGFYEVSSHSIQRGWAKLAATAVCVWSSLSRQLYHLILGIETTESIFPEGNPWWGPYCNFIHRVSVFKFLFRYTVMCGVP